MGYLVLLPPLVIITTLTVGLANTKNRDKLGWLLLSILLPVLALILVIVLPPLPLSANAAPPMSSR